MTSIEARSRVDGNGMLNLSIPFGTANANREVRVVVEVLDERMSDEQWKHFVQTTSGSIPDSTFQRHPEGEIEQRAELP